MDKWYDIIQLSPNGKLLAVGVQYGSLYVYDVDKNEILAGTHNTQDYFKGFGAPITFSRIMFDENSTVLRTVGYDEVIKYWDAFTLEQIKDVTGTENSFVTTEKFNNIVWSDGLIFTRDLNKLKVWSGVDKTRITESPLPTGEALAVNLEGTRLYVSSSDGFISAWGYKP